MTKLERYFKALADATRLRIINLLMRGEMCVCDIQFVLGAAQPNISRHLSYLKNAGLVLGRRDGYRIFYRLADLRDETRDMLFGFLREVYSKDAKLTADKKRLKAVIQAGACALSERPPSVVGHRRTATNGR